VVDVTKAIQFALDLRPDEDGKIGLRITGAKKHL
jgi:hypothetical protein